MKANKMLLSKKTFIKTTSTILSLVMTVNIGLNLLTEDVFAADEQSTIEVEDRTITLSTSDPYASDRTFYIGFFAGRWMISKSPSEQVDAVVYDPTSSIIEVTQYCELVTISDCDIQHLILHGRPDENRNATFINDSGYEARIFVVDGEDYSQIVNYGTLTVDSSIALEDNDAIFNYGTFEITNISGNGNCSIFNDGTFIFNSDFATSSLFVNGIEEFKNGENGTIVAYVVSIDTNEMYTDETGSEIHVSDLIKVEKDINSVVVAEEDTIVFCSSDSSFTLQVGDAKKTISGSVNSKKAIDLFDDPNVTLDNVTNVYYGENYDFSTNIHTADGYTGTPYLEYSDDGLTYSTDKPETEGKYYVRAVAPAAGSYKESRSSYKSFRIDYLAESEIDEDGNYFTYGNVVEVDEQKYVDEKVKVVPKDGYKIYYNLMDDDGFVDYLMLSYDDIFDDYGNYRYQVFFKYKIDEGQEHAGAETKDVYINSDSPLNFQDIIFDTDVPAFEAYVVDPDTGEYDVAVEIDGENATVTADELAVSIHDENLASVTYKIGDKTYDVTDSIVEGYCDITLNGVAKKAQVITITAKDVLGKTSEAKFTLYHEPVDPTLTVTMPAKVYVGEDYTSQIKVETNSDGEQTINYTYPDENLISQTPPTEAGSYGVKVSVAATLLYNEASKTVEFEIVKRDIEAEVSVENITVGGTVSPVMADVPEDYTGTIKYEYKLSTAEDTEYSETVPSAAGTYSVRATLPETAKYNGTTCEAEFTISKNGFTPKVSVANITVDGTVSPVMSDVPDDYNGTITYEYKLSTATTYSSTVPEAAGTYNVRANLPATDKYLGTSCTGEFTISKNEFSPSVSVANITVGGTVSPVMDGVPEDYTGTITYEYKISTAEDTEYSETVPTAAGTYSVRATLSTTDKYLGASCTNSFTISKNEFTPKVSVANITVGGTVTPVMADVPEDYDGTITYEYKLSTATEYSSTVPTAAGTYNVRANLPATDKYLSTSCTGSFTISKNEFTPKVSVANITVGGTVTPVMADVPEDYDGAITYEYKLSTATSYSSTVPTAAGEYSVRANLPATDKYASTYCTGSFTISKNEFTPSVSVANITVGGTVTPVMADVPNDYDGTITYEYKISTATEYSSTVPSAAGTYVVRANLPATDKYLSSSCTNTFTISKNEFEPSVSVANITVGEAVTPVMADVPVDYDGTITYEYKLSTATTYSSTVPTAAGEYSVRANLPATDKYESTSCTNTFTISKNEFTPNVSVANITVGGTVSPVMADVPVDYEGTIT